MPLRRPKRVKAGSMSRKSGAGRMGNGRFRLRLLGSFGLFSPDGRRVPIASRKGMALIAQVALAKGGERSRTWLQDQLWGSRLPDQARASLRRELSNLRIAINPPHGPTLIDGDSMRVRIDLDAVDVDVRLLSQDVASLEAEPLADIGELLEGLDLPGEEGFEDWLREQRQHVADLVERARDQRWARSGAAPPIDAAAISAELAGDPPLPGRPSVGVLGLAAPGGDPSDAAAAMAITEEICTALARYSTLFVVSGGARPEVAVDHLSLCRRLGVRYLLDGTLLRSGASLRIPMRLVDGAAGEQVWAERFEGRVEDLFDLQDSIAAAVAPMVDATIEQAERRHALARPVGTAAAYDLYWRANALFRLWEPGPMAEAIALAERILELEPGNAWAAVLAAFCHSVRYAYGWTDTPEDARACALAHYDSAMRHGADDPFVLGYAAGTLIGVGGDLELADRLVTRALDLHPLASATLFWGGWVDVARGDAPRALERFQLALRVNPRSAVRAHTLTGMGIALLSAGRPAEALAVLEDAGQRVPQQPLLIAALALAHLATGSLERAGALAARLDELGGVRTVAKVLRNPHHLAALTGGLELARAAAAAAART